MGGANIPVILEYKSEKGQWEKIGASTTEKNGRIKSFSSEHKLVKGLYRLSFDMNSYQSAKEKAFFPEMTIVFRVDDAKVHYHVPIVVSPFGYSTYRGN